MNPEEFGFRVLQGSISVIFRLFGQDKYFISLMELKDCMSYLIKKEGISIQQSVLSSAMSMRRHY